MSIRPELALTAEEQAMLAGEMGPAVRRAMEIVTALGRIYGATRLVPVTSAQIAGVSYKNLGDAGLEFLRTWADEGARVRVPTTLNPSGVDLRRWRELGFPEAFSRQQEAIIAAYSAMGIHTTCTCTPYLIGHRPNLGDHVAWAESSAVSFANSVLGARTNREGGPSALAAAICGRTAAYGYHLDEGRLAHYRVRVRCPLRRSSDWSALGYLVGRQVRDAVPLLLLSETHGPPRGPADLGHAAVVDCLKSLGAAMAASGAVALYHVADVTPEARSRSVASPNAHEIVIDDLSPGYAALGQSGPPCVDLVSLGCPHASVDEIHRIAEAIKGRRLTAALWITTASETRQSGMEDVVIIERAGGHVVSDTCMVVAPTQELGFRVMATNSAKMAFYGPSHSGVGVRFGSLEQCLDAALTGLWRGVPDS